MALSEAADRLVTALSGVLHEFVAALGQEEKKPDQPMTEDTPRPYDEHVLGKRQRQIVELSGMASDEGMKTSEIASAIRYEVPNTYATLQALVRAQVVEQVPAKEPQHWRLVRRYRAGPRIFTKLVEMVDRGEWATPGDISIAGRGDIRAAEAIARAAISHRILIDGRADGESRQVLEAEGVVFLDDGRADPRQRVSWEELVRRRSKSEERRRGMAHGRLNYIEIPAEDLDRSVDFYEEVFGWRTTRQPAHILEEGQAQTSYPTFADSSGNVGGGFVMDRPPSREPGLLPSILVDSIEETLRAVVRHGGEVVKPKTPIVEGADWMAIFRDPAGNALALYEATQGTQ